MAQNGRPKDAWRAASAGAGAAKPARGTPKPGARPWVIAAFVVAALAGAITGLFVYLKPEPEPVVLVLPITQYKHPDWPANPYAENDARAFFEAFPNRSTPAFPDQEKARLLAAVQRVIDDSEGPARSRPVVVYLNALGVAQNGVPYILPGDADPADDTTWLPTEELLTLLRRAQVPILLILDIRPVSSIRSVLATADWNDALQAQSNSGTAPEKFLAILSANNPPSGPTLLRPLRQSLFGLALAQAVGGQADGWNDAKHSDGKVVGGELRQYAARTTLLGTRAHGGGEQLPALFGSGAEFTLAHVPISGPRPIPQTLEPEAYPDWLKTVWVERDRWTAENLPRRVPRLLQQQAVVALRAEEAWFAGMDASANRERHESILKKLAEAGKQFPVPVAPKKSIARWSTAPDATAQTAAASVLLRPVAVKIQSDEPVKKEEWQQTVAGVRAALDLKAAEIPPEAVQAGLFEILLGLKSPTHEQIIRAAALVATIPGPNKLAESMALQWMAALPPEQVREWEKAAPGTLLSLLLLIKSTEQALTLDGRILPWLRGELERLDKARRSALVVLGSPESGIDDFRTAKDSVDSARKDYDKVRDAADRLRVCLGEIEEGRAVLADLAARYPHKLAPSPAAVASEWQALVEQYRKINALARPQVSPGLPKLDDLAQATRAFDIHRANLVRLRIGADDADPKRLELALRWTWLKAGERESLRLRHAEASQAAAKRALDRWPSKPDGDASQAAPGNTVKDDTLRDLRIATDLLTLANAEGIEKLQTQAARLDGREEAGLRAYGNALRQLARKALPEQYRAAELPRRAELGWILNPDDLPAVPLDADLANPEPAYRKQREIELARWLGLRIGLEAGDLRSVKDKACRDAADDLDALASAYRNWNP